MSVCVGYIRKRRKKSIPFLGNSFHAIFSMYNVSDRLWNGLTYAAQLNRLRVGEADKDVDRNSRALMLFGRQRSSLLLLYTIHVCAYYCRWKIASCVFFFVTNNIVAPVFVSCMRQFVCSVSFHRYYDIMCPFIRKIVGASSVAGDGNGATNVPEIDTNSVIYYYIVLHTLTRH